MTESWIWMLRGADGFMPIVKDDGGEVGVHFLFEILGALVRFITHIHSA